MKIKVGDVVQLKSGGGPKMTVSRVYLPDPDFAYIEEYNPPDRVLCIWHENDALQSRKFVTETLMVCSDS